MVLKIRMGGLWDQMKGIVWNGSEEESKGQAGLHKTEVISVIVIKLDRYSV